MPESKMVRLAAWIVVLLGAFAAVLMPALLGGGHGLPISLPAMEGPLVDHVANSNAPALGRNLDATQSVATQLSGVRVAAVTAPVLVAALTGRDQDRLKSVNAVLRNAGLAPLPHDATIDPKDLDAFREVVDTANRSCDAALSTWRSAADTKLGQLKKDLMERLGRGETDGLPLESPDNSMKRRHKYEALSLIMHEGRNYVIRVPIESEQDLLRAGAQMDSEERQRLATFDSVIRSLITTPR